MWLLTSLPTKKIVKLCSSNPAVFRWVSDQVQNTNWFIFGYFRIIWLGRHVSTYALSCFCHLLFAMSSLFHFISFHQHAVKDHLALHGLNFQCQCRGASLEGYSTSPTWGFVTLEQVVIPLSRPHGPSAPSFGIRWIKLENSDINRPKDYVPRTEFVGEQSCNGDQRGYQDIQPGQKIR